MLICILTEDWLRDSQVSELIDKCKEAGVKLKASVDPHGTLLKPLQKTGKKIHLQGYGPARKRAHFERNQK